MRTLARGQITIQFGDVFENGDTWKGFDDFEYLLNLRLQMQERGLATALFELFASGRENSQPCAADEYQLREVKHKFFNACLRRQERRQMTLQFGSGGSVETAVQFDGGGRVGRDEAILDLDFE